jgi:hypothetical protein
MPKALLFVHGTGVRGKRFSETVKLIRRQLDEHNVRATVRGSVEACAGARSRERATSGLRVRVGQLPKPAMVNPAKPTAASTVAAASACRRTRWVCAMNRIRATPRIASIAAVCRLSVR